VRKGSTHHWENNRVHGIESLTEGEKPTLLHGMELPVSRGHVTHRRNGAVTIFNPNLGIQAERMGFGRSARDAEDGANLVIRLALAEPEENGNLAR
jgi:hypothetical protein